MNRFCQYGWGNPLLIALQMPLATRVAGFQTWKSLGRLVKKSEKGIMILASIVVNRKNDETASEETEEKGISFVGFKPVHIWAESQTDAKPV